MSRVPRLLPAAIAVATTAAALAMAASPAAATTLCIDPPPPTPTPTPGTPPSTVPSQPLLKVYTADSRSISVSYQLPYGCYDMPVGIRFVVNDLPRNPFAGGPTGSAVIDGLLPGREYTIAAEYLNEAGDWTTFGTVIAATTPEGTPIPPPPTPTPTPTPTVDPTPTVEPSPTPEPTALRTFVSKGSMLLRTAGLAGTFAAPSNVNLSMPLDGEGDVSGNLNRVVSPGTFLIAGLIPAKTVVTFGGGPITGALAADRVTATATGPFSIGKTTVLGITINASDSCRTVSDARIGLAGPVTAAGGRLAGSFVLPRFTGCGSLGSFLGATSAKSAISLALAPVPPPALPAS